MPRRQEDSLTRMTDSLAPAAIVDCSTQNLHGLQELVLANTNLPSSARENLLACLPVLKIRIAVDAVAVALTSSPTNGR